MHNVQIPKVQKSGSNNMSNIIKNMLQRSIIIIINYYLFMQHFSICEARLELARGFLGKAQA